MTTTQQELSGLGRDALIARVEILSMELVAERAGTKALFEELLATKRENKALTDNVTALQRQSTELVTFRRLDERLLAEPALAEVIYDLAERLERARKLHPSGSSLCALMSETGEAARALEREDAGRLRSELLDCAVVTVRLLLGELDDRMAPREPFASGGKDASAFGPRTGSGLASTSEGTK